MTQEVRHIDIGEITEAPAWRELVEEVELTGCTTIIRKDGRDIAELRPATARTKRGIKGQTAFDTSDRLWDIVGIVGHDDGPTDVSANKHKYLAEAYTPRPK